MEQALAIIGVLTVLILSSLGALVLVAGLMEAIRSKSGNCKPAEAPGGELKE